MDKVQHFEIPADDLARGRKFYETVFGWRTQDFPMADGSTYVGLHTGPTDERGMTEGNNFINGGMFKRGGNFAATAPVITPVVENLDATIEKVQAAGGQVVEGKKEVEGMGWYAYVKESEGNIIGIWKKDKKA